MSEVLSVNVAATSEFCQSIQEPLEGYLAFSLTEVSQCNNVGASATHDSLLPVIRNALVAWSDLIVSDASAIETAVANIKDADMAGARLLMGVKA